MRTVLMSFGCCFAAIEALPALRNATKGGTLQRAPPPPGVL